MKILLIEDNPLDARLVKEYLDDQKQLIYQIKYSETLFEALQILAEESFDIILLDLNLPDSFGIETFYKIYDAIKHTPIILLTGIEDEELATKAIADGAQDYLIKGQITSLLLIRTILYSIERKKNEKALSDSEQRFRSLYENSIIGIYRTTPSGKIILANPTLVNLLGYSSSEELSARNLEKDGFDPLYERKYFIEQIEKNGEVIGLDSAWYRKDGTVVYIRESARAIRDSNGMSLYYDGTVEDITERKLVEEDLKESEKKFRTVVEEAAEIVFTADNHGYFTYVNPAGLRSSGYSLDELKKLKYIDLIQPEFKQKVKRNYFKQYLERSASTTTEYQFQTKSGEIKWFNQNARLIIENDEVNGFYVIARDVTERRIVEEGLKESEEKYRKLVEGSPDAIFIYSEGKVVFANSSSVLLMRASSVDELIGKSVIEFVHPVYKEFVIKRTIEMSKSDAPSPIAQEKFIRLDGSEIDVEVKAIPTIYNNKQAIQLIVRDITERRLAEEALIASEEKIRALIEQMYEGLLVVDNDDVIQFANPMFCKMLGYKETELMDKIGYKILLDETDRIKIIEKNRNRLKGISEQYEIRMIKKSGEQIIVSMKASPVTDKNGKFVGSMSTCIDITDIKRAEEALNESEHLFHTLALVSPVGIFKTNRDGYTTYVNPKWCQISGLPADDALGNGWLNAVHPDDREKLSKGWQKSTRVQKASYSEYRFLHQDGTIAWVMGQAVPETNSENQIIGYIGVITDISERKRNEELLIESEEKYKLILRSTMDVIFIADKSGKLLFFNESVERVFGYKAEELIGESFAKFVQKKDLIKFFMQLKNVFQHKEIFNFVSQIYHKDGHLVDVEINGKLIKQKGKYVAQGSIRDITDRKRTEEALLLSEKKHRDIFTYAPVGIYQTTNEGNFITLNDQLVKILGFDSIDELMQRNVVKDIYYNEEERKALVEKYVPIGSVANLEVRWKKKDGTPLWIGLNSHAIKDDSNRVLYFEGFVQDISERKRIEEELLKLSRAVEQSPASVIITDTKGNIEYINPKVTEITGYQLAEVLGKNPRIFKSGEKPKSEYKILWDTITLGKEWRGEFHNKKKNGELYWESASISAIVNEKGETTHYLAVKEDITQHKKDQDEISRMANVMEATPDFVGMADPGGNVIYLNHGGKLLMGISDDEDITKLKISDFHPKDVAQLILQKGLPAASKEGYWSEETRILSRTGEDIPVLQVILCHKNSNNVITYYSTIIRDIREIKLADEELRLREAYLSAIIENQPGLVWIKNTAGQFLAVNNAFTVSSGKQTSINVVGKTDFDLWSRELAEKYSTDDALVMQNAHSKSVEELITVKDEAKWFETFKTPVKDVKGIIIGTTGYSRDITERKRAEQELIIAKEKAEEMNRVKFSFYANMSHELRTPLIGVLGFSDILVEELNDNEDLAKMAKIISSGGQRLLRTLNFVLDISKLEAGKIQINLRNQNIVQLAKETFELFSASAAQKQLGYSYFYSANEILCEIDSELFVSILSNLLNNALRFTEKGNVIVNLSTLGANAIIEIADTGIGIAQDKQQLVWEEFRQASEGHNRNYEGTGLGLTIAQKYAQLMGGTISLKSQIGLGSTFTLVIPLAEQSLLPVAEQNILELKTQNADTLDEEQRLILYVEDDPIAIDFLSLIMKGKYRVDIVTNGKDALKMVAKKQYDAILMDVNLSQGMDGVQVSEMIRTMRTYRDTPIIAITAFAMESEKKEFLARGMSHHFSKPFTRLQFLEMLKGVFEEK